MTEMNEIDLTPEDETLLDAIWDELADSDAQPADDLFDDDGSEDES